MATIRFGSSRHVGRSARSVECGHGSEAVSRKGIPLRAFENNQFRSVAKAMTPYHGGGAWSGVAGASWTSCTREVRPSLV